MTAVCIVEDCTHILRDHEDAALMLICTPCHSRARGILQSIPAALLILRGSMQRERSGDTGRAGTRTAPTPGRLDVLNLVGPAAWGSVHDPYGDQIGHQPIAGVLGSWVRLVCEERHLAWPARRREEDLAAWLTSQLGWISQQEFAGELVNELWDLSVNMRGIMSIDVRTRPVQRPCPRCDLISLSRTDWDQYIRCSNCGGCWTVDELNHDAERRAAA